MNWNILKFGLITGLLLVLVFVLSTLTTGTSASDMADSAKIETITIPAEGLQINENQVQTPKSPPDLFWPVIIAQGTSAEINWASQPVADQYNIAYNRTNTFTGELFDTTTSAVGWQHADVLTISGAHFYQVSAEYGAETRTSRILGAFAFELSGPDGPTPTPQPYPPPATLTPTATPQPYPPPGTPTSTATALHPPFETPKATPKATLTATPQPYPPTPTSPPYPPPATPTATPPAVVNLLQNGDFEAGTNAWLTKGVSGFSVNSGGYVGNSAEVTTNTNTNRQLYQTGVSVKPNTAYIVTFAAYSATGDNFQVQLIENGGAYPSYGLSETVALDSAGWQIYTFNFTTNSLPTNSGDARFRFRMTSQDTFYIDEVELVEVSP